MCPSACKAPCVTRVQVTTPTWRINCRPLLDASVTNGLPMEAIRVPGCVLAGTWSILGPSWGPLGQVTAGLSKPLATLSTRTSSSASPLTRITVAWHFQNGIQRVHSQRQPAAIRIPFRRGRHGEAKLAVSPGGCLRKSLSFLENSGHRRQPSATVSQCFSKIGPA